MFGKHWVTGRGLIVDKREIPTQNGMETLYEFVVEVTATSGEVFRARADEPHIATDFKDPAIGDTVGIEYDEKSHDVRFDKDDPQLSKKAWKHSRPSTFDESLHAAPGTPTGGPARIDAESLGKAEDVTDSGATPSVDGPPLDREALREALLRILADQPVVDPPASEQR